MNWELVFNWMRTEVLGDRIFPREVGIYRDVVRDDVELMMYVVGRKYVDCYSSIFSNWQIRRRMFDVVFLDIDAHDGDLAAAEKKLKMVLDILGDDGSVVYFTGRGYHVYYLFPIVRLEHYGDCVRKFIREMGVIEYVDRQVVGDIRRIARIPETINSKSGNKMELIKETDRYCDWWKELMKIDEEMGTRRDLRLDSIENEFNNLDLSELPLCVRQGIETLAMTGELEHEWRLAMSIFLLKVWDKDEVKRLFKLFADDYNERMTEYQLNWLLRNNYKCYSCKKMWELGICPFKDVKRCAWYKLSNGWLENVVGDGR